MNEQEQRPFLRLFEYNYRGSIYNTFLDAVRSGGAQDVAAVVNYVSYDVERQIESCLRYGDEKRLATKRLIRLNLAKYADEAEALAAQALVHDQAPPQEKAARKAAAAAWGMRLAMESKPASEAQITYLRGHGYDGPIDNRWHAHELIEGLKTAGARR